MVLGQVPHFVEHGVPGYGSDPLGDDPPGFAGGVEVNCDDLGVGGGAPWQEARFSSQGGRGL